MPQKLWKLEIYVKKSKKKSNEMNDKFSMKTKKSFVKYYKKGYFFFAYVDFLGTY